MEAAPRGKLYQHVLDVGCVTVRVALEVGAGWHRGRWHGCMSRGEQVGWVFRNVKMSLWKKAAGPCPVI